MEPVGAASASLGSMSPRHGSIQEVETMIWLLVLLLLLLAFGGGIFVSKLLFILVVVAIVVAIFGSRSTV
jgi:hypothetical protein